MIDVWCVIGKDIRVYTYSICMLHIRYICQGDWLRLRYISNISIGNVVTRYCIVWLGKYKKRYGFQNTDIHTNYLCLNLHFTVTVLVVKYDIIFIKWNSKLL